MKKKSHLLNVIISSLLSLSFLSGAALAETPTGDKTKSDKGDDSQLIEPKLSVTEHCITINGSKVRYKATAGYMLLKDYQPKQNAKGKDSDDKKEKKEDHKSRAKVFFVAYTRVDLPQENERPICFSFNGGPGSASVWLHMGALGPRKAVLTDRGEAPPPPYRLEDNQSSWLDCADLVFIDPVSTGFSRSEPDEDPKSFHNYKADIESVGEFIRLYLTKNNRWTSPKFVVGESYGTTRAAGLSDYLQNRYAIYLNGIVLVSSVLNFATLDFAPGNDLPYSMFLPSYAASAWYHKKLSSKMQSQSLDTVLEQAEQFASGDYLLALFKGGGIAEAEKQAVSNRLSSLTGLSPEYIAKLNNRIPAYLFFTRLLMDSNRQLGRYDSRYTGIRYHPGTDRNDFDPSFEAVTGPFTATFNHYIRSELLFKSELPYETLADVSPWKFNSANNRYLNVAEDLRKAMSRNPYLKVLVCSGYYDLATPYFGSKYTIDHMNLDPSISKNIHHVYYESGHMMYVYKPALDKLKSDFKTFIDQSILPGSKVVPSASP